MIDGVIPLYTWAEKEYWETLSASSIAVDIQGMLSAFLHKRFLCELVLDVTALKRPGLN